MCPFAFRGHEVTIWDAQFQYDFIGRLQLNGVDFLLFKNGLRAEQTQYDG